MFGNCFHDGYCRELHLVPHFWKRIHGGDKHGRHHCQCWLLLHLDGCREYGAFRGHRDIWREAWLGKHGIESATLSLCQYRPRLGPFQFFWYYLSAFCNCYHATQMDWFIGSLICIFFVQLYPFILCFLSTLLWYFGIKCKIGLLFRINHCLIN